MLLLTKRRTITSQIVVSRPVFLPCCCTSWPVAKPVPPTHAQRLPAKLRYDRGDVQSPRNFVFYIRQSGEANRDVVGYC